MRLAVVAVVAVLAACNQGAAVRWSGPVELIEAPPGGDVASYVTEELQRAKGDRVPVLVYVGAEWCEPCRKFQEAARAGQLDAELGPLRLLVFDLDRDQARLEAANYRSELVPLVARPAPDGTASGVQTDGVKTNGGPYVEQLVPRVRALVPPT